MSPLRAAAGVVPVLAGYAVISEMPSYPDLQRLTVDLVWHPTESEEHFEARCRAVVRVRRELRAAGYAIEPEDEWERSVGTRMDAEASGDTNPR